MESSFFILVIAAFIGLVVKSLFGFNPWALLSSLSLLALVLPLIPLSLERDPQVVQAMANSYITTTVNSFPTIVIGEAAGIFASNIFNALRQLF
jgi:uncharacterized membrane protein YgaE (UPF0421/DUF939 family)